MYLSLLAVASILPFALCNIEKKQEEQAIPPGFAATPLITAGPLGLLHISTLWGFPLVQVNFTLISNTANVILDQYPNASQSYVPAGYNSTALVSNVMLQQQKVGGPVGYDLLQILPVVDAGQLFLNATNGSSFSDVLGFGFNKAGDLGSLNFVENLYIRGYLNNPVISMTVNQVPVLGAQGIVFIGIINPAVPLASFSNYTVTMNNGDWAFTFNNFAVGNVPFGYNGFVTVNTNTFYNVVPMSVFSTLLNYFNLSQSAVSQVGNLTISAEVSCSQLNISTLPNVTYYLSGKPFILKPSQYVLYNATGTGGCSLAFAGSEIVSPDAASYTLGTMAMNMTTMFFDFATEIMGIAYGIA